jgi:peptide/nickel transport system permease protein
MKHRYKMWSALALLGIAHILVFFAGFFAPYSYSMQNRDLPYAPPMRTHFFDRQGRFHVRPFVYAFKEDSAGFGAYAVDHSREYPVHFFVRGSSYKVLDVFESQTHLFGVGAPARLFLLGTDEYGRDQFTRFLYGGQVSLAAGLIAAGLSLLLGVIIGALAGFYGGWIDEILMRSGELFLALPWLYLLFAVRAALPLHIAQWQVFLLLLGVCGVIGWARPARLIRGVVLSAKERNFVIAARTFGASDFYLLRRHVLPQTYGIILTQAALLIPQFILAEVTLTFLGLGVGAPMASWGGLISSLQHYYVLASYWWMFVPALLLIPIFAAYYAIADELQEHLKSVPL